MIWFLVGFLSGGIGVFFLCLWFRSYEKKNPIRLGISGMGRIDTSFRDKTTEQ